MTTLASTAVDEVKNTSEADPFFNFFYCGGSRDHTYTCYKYMPVTGSDGQARFDTDSQNVQGIMLTTADATTYTLTPENI